MSTSHPPSPHIYPLDASAASSSASLVHHHLPMGQQKQHNSLSIVLPSPFVCLRGTGVSVEPSVLRGYVLLELSEATAFKDINLQFRGKARLPTSQGERQANLIILARLVVAYSQLTSRLFHSARLFWAEAIRITLSSTTSGPFCRENSPILLP